MRKFSTLALLCIVLYSIFSRVGAAPSGGIEGDNSKGELVDIKANLVYPYKVNDTLSVLCLVGDFAAQHNGAVITADSAVRYEDEKLECFGNVLINKNTTYAYCDVAEYDSKINLATLYSKIVKVVDEDVTLYSYNFTFNTLDNIGQYWDGGVVLKSVEQQEGEFVEVEFSEDGEEIEPEVKYDLMESESGYYYADTKQVIGVGNVELMGEGYLMKSDSAIYDMALNQAHFFENTDIWAEEGEYIYGDAGLYDKEQALYSVTRNGYMLTDEQEIWGDSLEYYRDREEAILRRNIQIIDTTNKSMAFGDYAQYWGDVESVLLTRDPLVINFDTQQPNQPIDTLYLRGDTLRVISYVNGTGPFTDSLKMAASASAVPEGFADMMAAQDGSFDPHSQEAMAEAMMHEHDHDHNHDHGDAVVTPSHEEPQVDSLADSHVAQQPDSLMSTIPTDSIPTKQELKAQARKEKEAARVTAMEAREYRSLEKRRDKLILKIEERREKNKSVYSDSMTLLRVVADMQSYHKSSDTLVTDSLAMEDELPQEVVADSIPERDSLYRVFHAYGNVRSFRNDFQMVCDSLVSNSFDTVMTLYTKPILWSGKNQIMADRMDFYTLDGDLDYADFNGDPIMASQVIEGDTLYINQVKGKEMRAFFENNEVVRTNVNSNVQTIYYMQDEATLEVNTIAYIESGSATFLIENQELDGVIYRQQPVYTFAPLNRQPADVPNFLPGFTWEAMLRPTRDNILNRTIRPSQREEKGAVEKPTFPIQREMNRTKAFYITTEQWVDRIERVSPDAAEWMQSLGFTPGEPRPEGTTF